MKLWRRRGRATPDLGSPVPGENPRAPLTTATSTPPETDPGLLDGTIQPATFVCICGYAFPLADDTAKTEWTSRPLCRECFGDPDVCRRCGRRAAGIYLHYCEPCSDVLPDRQRAKLERRPSYADLLGARLTDSPEAEQPLYS